MRLKLKKQKKNEFILDIPYKQMEKEAGVGAALRIGGFVAAVDNGHKTFMVDCNLSTFRGNTLWSMSSGMEGIGMLNWMLEKDFDERIKKTIRKHLKDRYGDDIKLEKPDGKSWW